MAFGLEPMITMAQSTSQPAWADALSAAFSDMEDQDVWVSALAEDVVPGAMVGRFLHTVLRDQFLRLRDGDRFWYQNVFAADALAELESVRLADVIRLNSGVGSELQDDVFLVRDDAPPPPDRPPPPRGRRGAATMEALLRDGQIR